MAGSANLECEERHDLREAEFWNFDDSGVNRRQRARPNDANSLLINLSEPELFREPIVNTNV